MEHGYVDYLSLLDHLSDHLEKLAQLAQSKMEAVRRDDLMALDQVLKQEQAMALGMRGLEQKRLKLLKELGWSDLPLRDVPDHYPSGELRLRAKEAVQELQRDYQVYQSAAEAARHTLEVNLHEIEKILAGSGGGEAAGPGYRPRDIEPPAAMRTDIRA